MLAPFVMAPPCHLYDRRQGFPFGQNLRNPSSATIITRVRRICWGTKCISKAAERIWWCRKKYILGMFGSRAMWTQSIFGHRLWMHVMFGWLPNLAYHCVGSQYWFIWMYGQTWVPKLLLNLAGQNDLAGHLWAETRPFFLRMVTNSFLHPWYMEQQIDRSRLGNLQLTSDGSNSSRNMKRTREFKTYFFLLARVATGQRELYVRLLVWWISLDGRYQSMDKRHSIQARARYVYPWHENILLDIRYPFHKNFSGKFIHVIFIISNKIKDY